MGPTTGGTAENLPELDERLYHLDEMESDFLSKHMGIKEPEKLKEHIFSSQAQVYKVHPYPCIRIFAFTKLKICRLPAYDNLLKLGRERPGALFLDVGCCTGADIRKAVADGFPVGQIIGTDLHPEFWEAGHQLFKSTPETFPAKFIPGDIFDSGFLSGHVNTEATYTSNGQLFPDLADLTNLNPLRGRVSAISLYAIFHLFDEDQQAELAYRLGSLLSTEPGSMIFGEHTGEPKKGVRREILLPGADPQDIFCHSPESWAVLWSEVFGKEKVEVKAELRELPKAKLSVSTVKGDPYWYMFWSVTKI